jgi:hypothetical protein
MTPIAPSTLSPLLLTAAVGFAYVRRIRRSFGRQPYHARRTHVRLALLVFACAGLVFMAATVPVANLAPAIAAGLVLGGALGAFAVLHTQVEVADGMRCYTPHPWIGGVLSLLLVARLAWRFASGALSGGAAQAAQNASPLTLGIAATLVAFYLVNGAGLAWRMRGLANATRTPA